MCVFVVFVRSMNELELNLIRNQGMLRNSVVQLPDDGVISVMQTTWWCICCCLLLLCYLILKGASLNNPLAYFLCIWDH